MSRLSLVHLEKSCKSCLKSDGVFFRVGVSAVRGDEVADPTEGTTSSDPKAGREDQPQYAREYATVIELPHSRDNQAQDSCQNWIAHRIKLPPQWNHTTTAAV